MDSWNQFLNQTLWIIAIGAVFGLLMLLVIVFVMVRKMSEPEKTLRPIESGLSAAQQKIIAQNKEWLASAKLDYRANYQFGNAQSVAFQDGDLPRFLIFVFIFPDTSKLPWFMRPLARQRTFFRAVSYLEDLTLLDTTSAGNAGLLPRPLAYEQNFPDASLPQVWERHLEAEAYLSRKFGYKWTPLNRPLSEILTASTTLRMKHNRGQTLWPIRILYRFVWTRFRLRNRTIAQQYP